MKNLIRITWLRRSIQSLLVIRKLEPGGDLVESAKFKRPMPPDSENFAMIPLMVKLREQEAHSTDIPGEGMGAKLYELGLDRQKATFKLPSDGGPTDLAMIAEKLALTGTAGEMLEQFDRRHGEVLAGLREGLDRAHAVVPERFDLADPRATFTATSGGILRFRTAAVGLVIRAELAIAAGRGEVALESVLMTRRLSDIAFSENTAVAKLVAWNLDHSQIRPLKKGIDAGAWNGTQLETIRNTWGKRDTKDAIARTLNFEGVAMAILFDHAKRDRRLMMDLTTTGKDFPGRRLRLEAIPDAWFDANSAGILNRTGKWLEVIRQDQPFQLWWNTTAALDSRPRTWMDNILTWWSGFPDELTSTVLVRSGSRAMVDDSLARLACLLAEYREMHGNYPGSLAEIGGEATIDPLTGKTFVYRPDGEHFILYSIGPDGIDDGGTRSIPRPRSYNDQPDWVWREAW